MKDFEKITGTFLFGVFLFSFGLLFYCNGIGLFFGLISYFFGVKTSEFGHGFIVSNIYNHVCSLDNELYLNPLVSFN